MSAGCKMGYYKEHAKEFIENTINCDMSEQYHFFENHLNGNGTILDIGFGSGRDTLYFLSKGYDVYSIDPEDEFIKLAKEKGLQNVALMKAEDIDYKDVFDGIWACASLLHVSSKALNDVFKRCCVALKANGVMYISFKQGDFEGIRSGRYYLDLSENTLRHYLSGSGLKIEEIKITEDVRKDHSEMWLNAILIKE